MGGASNISVLICRVLAARREGPPGGRGLRASRGWPGRDAETLHELAPGCAAIVADPTVPVGPDLLDAAGEALRVVANFAVGYDNVDLDGVPRARRRGHEHAGSSHQRHRRDRPQPHRGGGAPRARGGDPPSRGSLDGLGPGRDARPRTERRHVWRRRAGQDRAPLRGADPPAWPASSSTRRGPPSPTRSESWTRTMWELDELLGRSDVVSLHAPGGEADAPPDRRRRTRAHAKPRGPGQHSRAAPSSTQAALATALEKGEIGAAGLDVYENEPGVPQELMDAPALRALPPHRLGDPHLARRDGDAGRAERDRRAHAATSPLNPIS